MSGTEFVYVAHPMCSWCWGSLADFRSALEMGARGFPSTLLREDARFTTVSRGWLPLEELERTLEPWLDANARRTLP